MNRLEKRILTKELIQPESLPQNSPKGDGKGKAKKVYKSIGNNVKSLGKAWGDFERFLEVKK